MSALSRIRAALRPHAVVLALAVLALVIAWIYAGTSLRRTSEMGLPLDDSYIYLTYAKQLGAGQPLTYFTGSGYSAGATSLAWPALLAPLWTVGARGHALVWVAFVLCALLYAASVALVYRIARASGPGLVSGVLVLSIAAFAWTALSGMEVALASALLLATIALLITRTEAAGPSGLLVACLAALGLVRPEAWVLVGGVCLAHAIVHRRERRAALLWLAPLLAPLCWLVMNRAFAGHWLPSTAIAKSQQFQPGFTWGAWGTAFATNAGKLVKGMFWDQVSPLPQARLFGLVWIVGVARAVWWARWQGPSKRVAVALIVGAPIVWCVMVLAASGLWTLHQYRYIAPVMPLFAIPIGMAIAPVARVSWSGAVAFLVSVVVIVVAAWIGVVRHRVSAVTYAQAVADTNAQVVKLGRYIHAKLPGASVMLHDAGAIAYYGDGRIIDMLGLVTDDTMGVAANGPGSRFEYLESMPADARPTHFAYYTGWLGAPDFLGRMVIDTPYGSQFAKERIVGGKNMELVEASFDHVGTGERVLGAHPGWRMVDRVDVADLASERAHGWSGALGVRTFAEPQTTWSFVARDITDAGLVLDGGRTIRGGHEAFTITRDPAKPVRLVLRTGGAAGSGQATIGRPATLHVSAGGVAVGDLAVAVPSGRMVEVELTLPAGEQTYIAIRTDVPYRSFHWFVLQPE